ncbi:TetR family transcriptional regulator [Actinoplanes sp. Pm04-4]|uniref:TetR family transcriptional regulator n=1 Tax=Paractinoplanes pyxinae TaxID=2997416 RepID=A0ABT4B2W4_9ACTN|nr:TetR family transcriptional regulator [Actinoplanes pyxinae]MCY1140839.1 TetR family transcriptional regulator [Actinoplanes pyxinae]
MDATAMRRKITEAAIATIAAEGVGASTAAMAKLGGLAQGSIFHHYETKAGLLNAVYRQLKEELRAAVMVPPPSAASSSDDEQLRAVWERWIAWGTVHAERRRALNALNASEIITSTSRDAAERDIAAGVDLFTRMAAKGPLAGLPIQFTGALVEAVAGATMDAMLRDPEAAADYRDRGFDALKNMLR